MGRGRCNVAAFGQGERCELPFRARANFCPRGDASWPLRRAPRWVVHDAVERLLVKGALQCSRSKARLRYIISVESFDKPQKRWPERLRSKHRVRIYLFLLRNCDGLP